jgi:hypothetical protein
VPPTRIVLQERQPERDGDVIGRYVGPAWFA